MAQFFKIDNETAINLYECTEIRLHGVLAAKSSSMYENNIEPVFLVSVAFSSGNESVYKLTAEKYNELMKLLNSSAK